MDAFPDRRDQLFGREVHVHYLTNRAMRSGVTVVAARPLMGKTWTLHEVARRLIEEGSHVVGYHESKAAESSHLLYAVSNLYARWLDDSTMREQAISMWKRHKKELVPRIGQFVGELLEKVGGKQLPEGIAAVVRNAFDGLADAQKDLQTGGIQIATLPYDQALSLLSLVSNMTGRRIALILDAWEKSPSIRSEVATLEAVLKHQDAWPRTHIFLAVRNPELDSTKLDNEAYLRARDISKINRAGEVYDLPPMSQEDSDECNLIVKYVRDKVPAAKDLPSQHILEMIDGYPGVLDFWTNEANRMSICTEEDMRIEASNAQALRYLELEQLLNGLEGGERVFAAMVAFFPRLDADRWLIFRKMLLKDGTDRAFEQLVDRKVLNDARFPTYGHDTRHASARRWFIEHERPLMRRISEGIVMDLASQVTGINVASRPYFEALAASSETAQKVGADLTTLCLIDAARSAFGDAKIMSEIEFDSALPLAMQQDAFTIPLAATYLVNRGVEKGRRGDSKAAIEHYTIVIDLPLVPTEIVAQAQFNRGVKRARLGDIGGAIADYTAVVDLPFAPSMLVEKARKNRELASKALGEDTPNDNDMTRTVFASYTHAASSNDRLKDLVVNQSRQFDVAQGKVIRQEVWLRRLTSDDRHKPAKLLIEKTYRRGNYLTGEVAQDPCKLVLVIYQNNWLAGTLTFELDSPCGLAVDHLYKEEADQLRASNRRLCDITRLAVNPDMDMGRDLIAALLHLSFILGQRVHEATDFLIEVNPRNVAFYQRTLGFEPLGKESMCLRVAAPVMLLRLDLNYANEQIFLYGGMGADATNKTLYPYFFSKADEAGISYRLASGESSY